MRAVPATRSTTNAGVLAGAYDVARVSIGLLPHLPAGYRMLRAGASVGRGCGPVVVTRQSTDDLDHIRTSTIAGGSEFLTSFLLLGLWAQPDRPPTATPLPVEEIFGRVRSGRASAGVVPAEGRVLARAAGLHVALDLGQWWEQQTGLPVPLCVTVARVRLGPQDLDAVEDALRTSVEYALTNRDAVLEFLHRTVDLDTEVLEDQWRLFPLAAPPRLDDEGYQAVEELLQRASHANLCPALPRPLR